MNFSTELLELTKKAEAALSERFAELDRISFENTGKVMDAFREHRVSEAMFNPTSGYGYDDRGRDTLDAIWADVMGAEAAFVRHSIVNGTQALTIGLFGLLRPGKNVNKHNGRPPKWSPVSNIISRSLRICRGRCPHRPVNCI